MPERRAKTGGACVEFDERLLESAFAPLADAELDSHLASCEPCRRARDRYLATADVLASALAHPPAMAHAHPPDREVARTRPARGRLVAIAVALAATAAALVPWLVARTPALEVTPLEHASLAVSGSERASLLAGSARFDLRRGALVVQTPLGDVRCEGAADFTVKLADASGEDSMNAKRTGVAAVTITVAAGVVWWVADGREVSLPAGEVVIESEGAKSRIEPASDLALAQAPQVPSGEVPLEVRVPAEAEAEPAAAIEPPREGFEMFGRVVDATTHQPVAGATVALAGWRSAERAFEAVATTDATGTFRARASAMPPARFAAAMSSWNAEKVSSYIEATADGYSPLRESPWGGFENRNPLDPRGPIDLGELELSRGSLVAGRVVRARDGSAVAGAAILLAEDREVGNFFMPCRGRELARTRGDGTFEFAERVGPPRGHVKHVLFAVSAEGLAWTDLDVVDGRERVDPLLLTIAPTARIEVVVRDPEGRPIEGATVTAEPRFEPFVLSWSDPSHGLWLGPREDVNALFSASTGADGRVELAHLPAIGQGTIYDVMARAEGRAPAWLDGSELEPGSSSSLALVIERHSPRTIAGVVLDEQGSPIAGASLVVEAKPSEIATTSGADGRFSIVEPEPTDFLSFEVSAPGYVALLRSMAAPRSRAVEGLELVLRRPLPIAGRVVDQHGLPVAGVRLTLNQGDQWRMLLTPEGRTQDDGRFYFTDATAGQWRMVLIGQEPRERWVQPIAERFVQGGDTDAEILFERVLDTGAELVAEVVDAATGAPLEPLAALMLQTEPAPGEAPAVWTPVARGVGSASAEHVRPGRWRLWVRATERAIGHADFEVAAGQREVRLRVELGGAGRLNGRVAFDERVPFRPVTVRARLGDHATSIEGFEGWTGDGVSVSSATLAVGSDGSFALEHATPGRWSVELREQGLLGSVQVDVPQGGVGRAEIEPQNGGEIVFRADGVEPVALMEVWLADGVQQRWRSSGKIMLGDADTIARKETVEPGRVRWRVDFKHGGSWHSLRDAAQPQEGELVVAAGQTLDVRVPCVLIPPGG